LKSKPPISIPLRRNYGLFDSKTSSSSGAPKKDPNGNGTPQNPAMKKDSQPIPTFYQHLSQISKKKNKQCSLEDEHGKRIKAVIAQKSDRRYFLDDA